ncbi:MAG: MipA/OmpV family protein [Pseudomonadota bacterium]
MTARIQPWFARLLLLSVAGTIAAPSYSQDQMAPPATTGADQGSDSDESIRRTRLALGAQVGPKFPGSDEARVSPYFDLSRARGDDPFKFDAPDQGFGLTVLRAGSLEVGPSIGFEGKRRRRDLDAPLPRIDWSLEVGAFAQLYLGDSFRVRSELRKGVTGHKGWVGVLSADYVLRDADQWLVSIGPRLTVGNRRHQDTYFGVDPDDAIIAGLAPFKADAGIQNVGAAGSFLYQLTPRWGIMSFAKYDRLVGDAGRSPIVRELGSRNQLSGGLALSYTFVKKK